jgi:hypothetical protein
LNGISFGVDILKKPRLAVSRRQNELCQSEILKPEQRERGILIRERRSLPLQRRRRPAPTWIFTRPGGFERQI